MAAAALFVALPVGASGQQRERSKAPAIDSAPYFTDGFPGTRPSFGRSAFRSAGGSTATGQHGPSANHLPAARENIEVVGKLELSTPEQYRTPEYPEPLLEGQIADVAVYKNAAYLNSWSEPSCRRGGFFSADISNPAAPRQLAFVPALPETYHGEGAHVVTFNGRDILAVNNEPCGTTGVGGFDLYDVTNPAAPVALVQGAGDQSSDSGGGKGDTTQVASAVPNSAHSIFLWQAGGRLFAVIVDNTELHDVDIFDVTNPAAPEFIADVDLVQLADEQGFDLVDNSANGDAIFHHDMVVKEIGGVQTMLVSYWDAGYVKLNVNDPRNPTFIGDSDFGTTDPLMGDRLPADNKRPEGNGHEAEFSHDNRFVLAADEDFSTYRTDFSITSGPNAGRYESGEFGFTRPIATLPDKKLNGPTVFGGRGCTTTAVDPPIPPADTAIPPSSLEQGEEQIVVISRGSCRFDEKIANAEAAGYEGVIIGNSHAGSDNGGSPDAAFCGSGDTRNIRAMCIGHRAMHLLFNDTPAYTGDDGTDIPLGANGEDVAATATFDGWGYTHLYRNNAGGDLERVDSFAIEEALDERYAFGFGDLSVHEHATDPTANLSYVSYYAGGIRVLAFGDNGLDQVGKFIDQGGSNFWGVEQVSRPNCERLIAGSDRDFGLYLLRYTGPGAVQACPPPPPPPVEERGRCKTVLAAAAGARPFNGTAFGDQITGTDGVDYINGRAGDDCIDGLSGADDLRGGTGVDTIDGQKGNDRIRGNSGRGNLRGGSGHDRLWGAGAKDVLFGNTGRDRLSGGGGADQLYGGPGNDVLIGGRGKDIIEAGTGNDRIYAKDGKVDRIDCGFGRDTVVTRDRKDKMTSCERR